MSWKRILVKAFFIHLVLIRSDVRVNEINCQCQQLETKIFWTGTASVLKNHKELLKIVFRNANTVISLISCLRSGLLHKTICLLLV